MGVCIYFLKSFVIGYKGVEMGVVIYLFYTRNGSDMKGEGAGATDLKSARKMVYTCSVAMISK